MSNSDKEIKVHESYVSFKNIDCFENACVIIDHLIRILKDPENSNAYWEKFLAKIPKAYYARDAKIDIKEELLYLVCSSVSNIGELFDEVEDEEAIFVLDKCETECC
ncbi:MAG: N(2)-fixation sustaining protein CowN [Denitrovibrio sp.]|nr:MAG: N(2)-fixation sustaining protein CowN [Denitrovibrio sp.]